MKYDHNKKGSVLLYLIITVAALTVLGAGAFYMTTTSSFSSIGVTARNRASFLAESGIRYSLYELRNNTLTDTSSPLPEYKLNNSAGDKFIREISGITSGGNISIKSTGVANPGTPFEASHKIEMVITPTQYQSLTGSGGGRRADTSVLTGPVLGGGASGQSGITVDTVNDQISLGYNTSTGSGIQYTAGCIWFNGWDDINGSECEAGRCNFNKGIRIYFDFRYVTPWDADGFTFAIISGHNNGTVDAPVYINNITDCGGGSCGEYIGYSGRGVTNNGLQPPKIAVEFDPYVTSGDTSAVCISETPKCSSRLDSSFADPHKHSAFIYWGTNSITCSSNTYDDNRHGEGDGTNDPKNSVGSDAIGNGYRTYDFDSDGFSSPPRRVWSFRMEIDRVDNATSADYRKYKLRAWLKPYAVYTDSNGVSLDDTSKKFNKNNDYPPEFQQTITLTQAWHDKFDKILFGWTQGTGGSTQKIDLLSNRRYSFKNKNDF